MKLKDLSLKLQRLLDDDTLIVPEDKKEPNFVNLQWLSHNLVKLNKNHPKLREILNLVRFMQIKMVLYK